MPLRGSDRKAARDFVAKVDNMFGQHATGEGPRFVVSNETEVLEGWRALVSSLKLRRDSSLAIDPSGPLYVGCSAKVQSRSKAYDSQSGKKTKLGGGGKPGVCP